MTRSITIVILLSIFVTLQAGTVPKRCTDSSEQCYDQRMHPDIRTSSRTGAVPSDELETEFWIKSAEQFTKDQAKRQKQHNENVAKNIIFFLGDGMSIPTLAATRVYIGGEEKYLSFEKFPHTGLSKTYCVDRKVPDSAATSTSYLCGVKANYGTIGVNAKVPRANCAALADKSTHTPSIAKWALDAGKVAGVVTTTRVTHASPAGNYAHVADRLWESDRFLPEECPKGVDIASQLVYGEVGSKLKVILGGGRREFRNLTVTDEEGMPGNRIDGKDLINEWLDADSNRKYVYNRNGLQNIKPEETDSLLGLFQDAHMLYHLEAENLKKADEKPTLEEMTRKAIEILSKNEKGFYLFVEGGKIDLAHHDVFAKMALDETAEFSKAIEAAVNMTSEKDTLIVVTSDHAHTMSVSGYPTRKNDIFGMAEVSEEDKLPFMTLSYANGNGFDKYIDILTNSRKPFVSSDADDYQQKFPSTIPIESETHGGEDVGVFALGPWSHLFNGVYEQNVIPHLMAYSACIGNGLKACD